jgi:hypothetical protein
MVLGRPTDWLAAPQSDEIISLPKVVRTIKIKKSIDFNAYCYNFIVSHFIEICRQLNGFEHLGLDLDILDPGSTKIFPIL